MEDKIFLKKLKSYFVKGNAIVFPSKLTQIDGWPEVEVPVENRPAKTSSLYYEKEKVDLENHEILFLTEDGMEIICGGDWQEPHSIIVGLRDGKLSVLYHDYLDRNGWRSGIGEEKIFDTFTNI